jgi:hypothetical protein
MDILTAVHDAATRLRDATESVGVTTARSTASAEHMNIVHAVTTVASEAAATGETAALALLHIGARDDAPAYLAAANAFTLAREELEHAAVVAPAGGSASGADADGNSWAPQGADGEARSESLTWDAGSTDPLAVEAALADLATALVTALAAASLRLAKPEHILVLGRAGLAAADAYRTIRRDPSDASHLR